MYKLLGMLVLGLTLTIGFSSIGGCKKGDPEKEKGKSGDGAGDKGDKKVTVTAEAVEVDASKEAGDKATITIARTGFDEDVTLTYDASGAKGITVEGGDKIKKGEKSTTVTVKADKASQGGEVKITAEGGGKKTMGTLKVTVKKAGDVEVPPPAKNELTLTPSKDIEVKAGDKKAVEIPITIARSKGFNEDVEISFKTPEDSKVSVKGGKIAKGETEGKFAVTADAAAAAAEIEATVTAKSGDQEKSSKFKIKVTKE